MFISIRHQSRYLYDRAVFLEPTTLRLTPRQDASQRLLRHDMRFAPEPKGASWSIEPGGTDTRIVWFEDMRDRFVVDCESIVQTLRENPFDSIITHDEFLTLPAKYPSELAPLLSPMTRGTASPAIVEWADEIARAAGHNTLQFLTRLTDEIFRTVRVMERPHGDPHPPERTLDERCGACRDGTMLFIEACRTQSIAARFVSGYSLNAPPEMTVHELHAWAEVHLPGGGWRGYDPSLGLAVADRHVALAAGPDHRLAAPLTGTYRGTGATSRLEYDIKLQAAEIYEDLLESGGT